MGRMLARAAFEDETARYSGGFRVMRILGVARAHRAGRALALRAEPRSQERMARLVPIGRRSLTREQSLR
jgi:hypothetical protein